MISEMQKGFTNNPEPRARWIGSAIGGPGRVAKWIPEDPVAQVSRIAGSIGER